MENQAPSQPLPPTAMAPERSFQHELHQHTPKLVASPIIIAINIAVFVLMAADGISLWSPSVADAFAWGASFGPATTDGDWWRILTSNYVHYGVIHIAMNLFVLADGSRVVERAFGAAGFTVLYTISGIGGSIVSLLVHPSSVSAGASGAVFGVFGGLGALVLRNRHKLSRQQLSHIGRSAGGFIAINVVIGMQVPNIDLAAHVGGLVIGFGCGLVLCTVLYADRRGRLRRAGLVGGAALAGIIACTLALPKADGERYVVEKWQTYTDGNFSVHYNGGLSGTQATALARASRRLGLVGTSRAEIYAARTEGLVSIRIFVAAAPTGDTQYVAHNYAHALGGTPVQLRYMTSDNKALSQVDFDPKRRPAIFVVDYNRLKSKNLDVFYRDNIAPKLANRVAERLEAMPVLRANRQAVFVDHDDERHAITFVSMNAPDLPGPERIAWGSVGRELTEVFPDGLATRITDPQLMTSTQIDISENLAD